jgi:HEAT repeat protein
VKQGRHNNLRSAGIPVLAKLMDVKDAPKTEIAEDLVKLVEDWWLRVKLTACSAVAEVGEERALPALARLASEDLDGRVRRSAAEAAKKIREGKDKSAEVKKLRDDLEGLREEFRKLRDEVKKKG